MMSLSDESLICLNESSPFLPQPYTFNPDIYRHNSLVVPRQILQTTSNSIKEEAESKFYTRNFIDDLSLDISVLEDELPITKGIVDDNDPNTIYKYMPHWNYHLYNPKEQEQFIKKYFPDRLNLYHHYRYDAEKVNLFVYLWLYMNGGVYLSPYYELAKSIETILDERSSEENIIDLYFLLDHDRYISPHFMASLPFCDFWLEMVNKMEQKKNHRYPTMQEEIDQNTGKKLLTEMVDLTAHKYAILPRSTMDPYNPCDSQFNRDSYLRPVIHNFDFMTFMKCQTGSSDEMIYLTGVVIFIVFILIIIALITS